MRGGKGLSFFNFQVISDPGYSKTNTKILVSALFQVKQTQQIWVKERKKKWKFYYFDAISGLVDTQSNINTEKEKKNRILPFLVILGLAHENKQKGRNRARIL